MHMMLYTFFFVIVCSTINLVNGQWYESVYRKTSSSHIIGQLEGVTITSCQLYCSRNPACHSIAIPRAVHMGDVVDCFLLKQGWDISNGSNEDTKMMHVLDVKLTPIGCHSQQVPIRNDACDPPTPPTPASPSNLALNKRISASSYNTLSTALVNGNLKDMFRTEDDDEDAWVEIDLGKVAVITKVICYAVGVASESIGSSLVTIGTSTSSMVECGRLPEREFKTDENGLNYFEVICSSSIEGQYVKVKNVNAPDGEILSSNEVQVWGVFKT